MRLTPTRVLRPETGGDPSLSLPRGGPVLPVFAGEESRGFAISGDGFFRSVEKNGAPGARRDIAKVTQNSRPVTLFDVGGRKLPVSNAVDEVAGVSVEVRRGLLFGVNQGPLRI